MSSSGFAPTKTKADLEAKSKAFREAVTAAGITLGATVAKMEVREVEMA